MAIVAVLAFIVNFLSDNELRLPTKVPWAVVHSLSE